MVYWSSINWRCNTTIASLWRSASGSLVALTQAYPSRPKFDSQSYRLVTFRPFEMLTSHMASDATRPPLRASGYGQYRESFLRTRDLVSKMRQAVRFIHDSESKVLTPHLSICSIPNVTSRTNFAKSSRSSGATIVNSLSVSVSRTNPP